MAGFLSPGNSRGTVQVMSLPLRVLDGRTHSSPPTVTTTSFDSTESRLSPYIQLTHMLVTYVAGTGCEAQKIYRIAGYFRGANISRLAVLVNFAENIFVDHCMQQLVSNMQATWQML